MRKGIKIYHEEKNQYPATLNELRNYLGFDKIYVDLTSERRSNIPEYQELNGKGGYYYDKNTGEIRLNLTKPVMEYLPRYKGGFKDEIPSSW
jgi:hypothetical protein